MGDERCLFKESLPQSIKLSSATCRALSRVNQEGKEGRKNLGGRKLNPWFIREALGGGPKKKRSRSPRRARKEKSGPRSHLTIPKNTQG